MHVAQSQHSFAVIAQDTVAAVNATTEMCARGAVAVCAGMLVHVCARRLCGFMIVDVPDCQRHGDHLHRHPRALVRLAQAADLQSHCLVSMSGLRWQNSWHTTWCVNGSLVSQLVSRALLCSVVASSLCCMPRLPASQTCRALSALVPVNEVGAASSVSLISLHAVPCAKSPGGRLCVALKLTNTGLTFHGNPRMRLDARGVEVC